MSGLLRRITSGRRAASDPAPDEGAAWPDGGGPTHAETDPAPAAPRPPVPAGTDLDALVGDRPTTQRRSRLRRRLRHLRRVRELLLRDLGGLVLEIHRSGEPATEAQSRLVGTKLTRLEAVSGELHELADILGERHATVLREPGIGGRCPLCGELHGSDARYCWSCGTPVVPGAARPVASTGAEALPPLKAPADAAAGPTWATSPGPERQA